MPDDALTQAVSFAAFILVSTLLWLESLAARAED